jgi:hypothetical protein
VTDAERALLVFVDANADWLYGLWVVLAVVGLVILFWGRR